MKTRSASISSATIQAVADRIATRFSPDKVILFGSRAWGEPRADSDVDLMVIMDSDERPARRSARISMECRPPFVAMDIMVRTPAEIEARLRIHDPFIGRILREGVVLYAR